MRLDDLAGALTGARAAELHDSQGAVEISGLAYDSRAVARGSLFFCVSGFNADGHRFASQAVESGAAALVVERRLGLGVPELLVPSARAAMAPLAARFYGDPSHELRIVGVTGTNGKTTTAYLVRALMEAAGIRCGLLGTVKSVIGGRERAVQRTTPEAIDLQRLFREMLDVGDRSCAMEASSHASELHRLDRVRFAALVFTNLSQDHLDFHGDMESYFQAKRRLFLEGGPPAAVNVADPYGRRLAQELPDALTFGFADDAEIGPQALAGIDVKLRGRFNMENALGALAAGRLLGIADDAIARGIESVRGVPGRFEAIDEGQPFTVIVDYAHKPGALENVLRAARDLVADGRVICVVGAGGDRDRGKRPLMGRLASELADLTIVTSDNPRSEDPQTIIDEIVAGVVGDVDVEPDRAAAISRAIERAREGDVVLIAGKGAEQGQQLADRTVAFDDREAARDALRTLAART